MPAVVLTTEEIKGAKDEKQYMFGRHKTEMNMDGKD